MPPDKRPAPDSGPARRRGRTAGASGSTGAGTAPVHTLPGADGVVRIADLDLATAHRLIAEAGAAAADTPVVDTASLQGLIDAVCAVSMADGLTGLFNRRYFDHRLRQELLRAQRAVEPCSVMIVDADHFKKVNDTYGHTAGDHVLQALGAIMRDALRATDDITTRFGGEEFAMILPGADQLGATIAAERVRAAAEAHDFIADGHRLRVTVSAGLATYDPSWANVEAEELIKRADAALYAAKQAGRNRVRVYGGATANPGTTTAVSAEEKDLLFK